jgi:hypothetical protein
MATAADASAATAPSAVSPLLGVVPAPAASWREFGRCPEWHSLRLFGRGRHPTGFEMGSDGRVTGL